MIVQNRHKLVLTLCLIQAALLGMAQESLLSWEETYFRFLELQGNAERPYLNYRSFSDNRWETASGGGPWEDAQIPGSEDAEGFSVRLIDPSIFASYNSAYPHGMNDGALWQGVGINTSLTFGFQARMRGFEIIFKPTVIWEENRYFPILPTALPDSEGYGYFWDIGVDIPQRLGDDARFYFDWGDSELRYSAGSFTLGFGTQAAWIGPGRLNAIILSNNAPSFPKVDIGIRRTPTFLGDIEARAFWGYLSESDYFNADTSDDHNLLTGLTLSWKPVFTPHLTLGLHRTMLTRWSDMDWSTIGGLIWPFMNTSLGGDDRDQRASLTADFMFPEVGFSCWIEWARNDYSPNLDYLVRYPFHSQGYTVGFRKSVMLPLFGGLEGEILVEITNLETSRDYEVLWDEYFYRHHLIRQGYTNQGQILGAGIQGGGNSQWLELIAYYEGGSVSLYILRMNRNNDYVYFLSPDPSNTYKYNTELTIGFDTLFVFRNGMDISVSLANCLNLNPLYNPDGDNSSILNNIHITTSIKYRL